MKRIVRLTESDLTRIVKQVIKEQETNKDDMATYQKIFNSVNGAGTNESDFFKALFTIGDAKKFECSQSG